MTSTQRARGIARRFSTSHSSLRLNALACVVVGMGLPMMAAAQATTYSTPGSYAYTVPAGTSEVTVALVGAGGGAGAWDGPKGGDGAPGTSFTASFKVQGTGAETITVVVGAGGDGGRTGGSGVGLGGAAGAGAGAGGAGGAVNRSGASGGGGGGGGASSASIGGAHARAGGGGGGGGASNLNATPVAVPNALLLNQQDAACGTPAAGGTGGGDVAGADGGGGGGGGGGYGTTAGAGGARGLDGGAGPIAISGGSGASCTLSAGSYVVTVASPTAPGAAGGLAEGPRTPAYGVPQPGGTNGSVTLTAIAAPVAVPTLGHLALALLAGGMGLAAAWRRRRVG